MALENDKIKDLFSSKFNNFEPDVPASIWGGLDQLLSEQPVQPSGDTSTTPDSSSLSTPSTPGGSVGFSVAKVASVFLGIAAAVTIVVMAILNQDDDADIQEENIAVVEEQEVNKNLVDSSPSSSQPLLTQIVKAYIPDFPKIENVKEEEKLQMENLSLGSSLLNARGMGSKNMLISMNTLSFGMDYEDEYKDKGMSMAFTSNVSALKGNVKSAENSSLLFSDDLRSKQFVYALNKENKDYDLDHQIPLSLGLLVSKNITSRLSLETGLYYIHTSSKITSKSMYGLYEEQTINYLGVPLNLNYKLLSLDKVDLYLSAGALIQKDIEGSYMSSLNKPEARTNLVEGVVDDISFKEPYYLKTNISQSKPQVSLHTNLGISYPLYRGLQIYGTVGGAYYLDAGNKYRTIYSDKKFQLDLNIGLRIGL